MFAHLQVYVCTKQTHIHTHPRTHIVWFSMLPLTHKVQGRMGAEASIIHTHKRTHTQKHDQICSKNVAHLHAYVCIPHTHPPTHTHTCTHIMGFGIHIHAHTYVVWYNMLPLTHKVHAHRHTCCKLVHYQRSPSWIVLSFGAPACP